MILIVEVEKKGEERSYKENVRLRKNKKLGRVSSLTLRMLNLKIIINSRPG